VNLQGAPFFHAQSEIAVLNKNAVTLGLFAQLGYQIQQRVAVCRESASGACGMHALDVLFAAEKP
jgi:hypothetical protein